MKEKKDKYFNDFDIIEPSYEGNYNLKPNTIVDAVPYTDDCGRTTYMDFSDYTQKIKDQKNKILDFIEDIKENNPLDFDFSLDRSDILITDYEDMNDGRLYVDYDGYITKKERIQKIGYSLKKIACAIGVALGITAAVKGVAHFHMDINNHVTVEDTKENSSTKETKVVKQKKQSKTKQTAKQNKVKKLKLGNAIKLKNAKLSYTSLGDSPSVNTNNLDYKQFKIKYVAVTSSNKVVDVIKVNQENKNMDFNEFEKNCHKTYGKKCNLSYGVYNAKDKNKVVLGWSQIKNKVKKLTK